MADRPDHTGNVVVEGPVTVEGTVSIEGPVSITGDVLITNSQLNIKTLNADNVLIDLLKESSWQERRAIISNDDDTATTHDDAAWKAKAYSRGCRGFIKSLKLRLKNDYHVPGSITETTDADFSDGTFYQTESLNNSVQLDEQVAAQNFGYSFTGTQNYPTTNAGYTTQGGTNCGPDVDLLFAICKFTLSEPLTINKIYAYHALTGTGNLHAGIYTDSSGYPSTLVVESGEVAANQGTGWQPISVSATYLAAGTYWIVFIVSVTQTAGYTVGDYVGTWIQIAQAYGALPSTFPSGGTSYTVTQSWYVQGAKIKGYMIATKAPLGTGAQVQSVKFNSHVATGHVRLAIFNNAAPKAKLWESGSVALAAGLNTVLIADGTPTTLTLTSGDYWVLWQYDDVASAPSYTAGTAGYGFYLAQTYGAYPATITGETSTSWLWTEYGVTFATYHTDGWYVSSALDTAESNPTYTTLRGNCTVPANTTIAYRFKAGSTIAELNAATFEGPTGGASWFTVNADQDVPDKWNGKRYCQYYYSLTTSDTKVTPSLDDMTVNWTAPSAATLPVYMKPHMSMGPVLSFDVTVPIGLDGWLTYSLLESWHYDSCIIVFGSVTTDLDVYYDTGEPYDGYLFSDVSTISSEQDRRYHIRLDVGVMTVGDVPVSGTINTIAIPSQTTVGSLTVLNAPETDYDWTDYIYMSGRLLHVAFFALSDNAANKLCPQIEIDGTLVVQPETCFVTWYLYNVDVGAGLGWSITKYDTANHRYCLMCNVPFPIRQKVRFGFYNLGGLGTLQGQVRPMLEKST